MTIEEILSKEENQTFDRKSINISPKDLAIPIVAFANADGGDIAIGITDRTRRIEGIDFETYFNECIGVTRSVKDRPQKVILKFNKRKRLIKS